LARFGGGLCGGLPKPSSLSVAVKFFTPGLDVTGPSCFQSEETITEAAKEFRVKFPRTLLRLYVEAPSDFGAARTPRTAGLLSG
jgi:hypothetical protein